MEYGGYHSTLEGLTGIWRLSQYSWEFNWNPVVITVLLMV